MSAENQQDLISEFRNVIKRFSMEYSLTYSDVIGVLEVLKLELFQEYCDSLENDEEDDPEN